MEGDGGVCVCVCVLVRLRSGQVRSLHFRPGQAGYEGSEIAPDGRLDSKLLHTRQGRERIDGW